MSTFLKCIISADDTNICRLGYDIKSLNKDVSHEFPAPSQWFYINKLSTTLEKNSIRVIYKFKII